MGRKLSINYESTCRSRDFNIMQDIFDVAILCQHENGVENNIFRLKKSYFIDSLKSTEVTNA